MLRLTAHATVDSASGTVTIGSVVVEAADFPAASEPGAQTVFRAG
jgi:hypothetical protein